MVIMENKELSLLLFMGIQVCYVLGGLTSLSQAESTSDSLEADQFLSSYGYYSQSSSFLDLERNPSLVTHSDTERKHALRKLQEFYHLPQTGQLDKQTSQFIHRPRCGNADVRSDFGASGSRAFLEKGEGDGIRDPRMEDRKQKNRESLGVILNMGTRGLDTIEKKRVKRYKISKYPDGTINKWHVDVLTWKITRPTAQLSLDKQRDVIRRALAVWAKVVPIKFVEERGSKKPAIEIWFTRGDHGTGNDPSFQGGNPETNKLAHAFGPGKDPYTIAGDVHFDEDDDWSNTEGLLAVAVHELGHSMGLSHSQDETSIMYAFYRNVVALSQDDIRGIEALYGGESGLITAALCTAKLNRVDAVFKDPSTKFTQFYFVLSGDRIHRLSNKGIVIKSRSVESLFPGAPSNADVVFSDPAKNSVFFIKGDTVWHFKDHKKLRHSRITPGHFPETPKISFTIENRNGRGGSETLLFGDKYWWSYDGESLRKPQYSLISEFSSEFPKNLKFAAQWMDGLVYAVKQDDSFVVLDTRGGRTVQSKSMRGKPVWLKALCNHGNNTRLSRSSLILAIAISFITFFSKS